MDFDELTEDQKGVARAAKTSVELVELASSALSKTLNAKAPFARLREGERR